MIAVFEGPRGVGKTSMIKSIVNRLELLDVPNEVFKAERGKDPITDMLETVEEFKRKNDRIWLVDRFHLTEFVMSCATRNADFVPMWKVTEDIDGRLLRANAKLYLLDASLETLAARIESRGDGRGHEMAPLTSEYWWDLASILSFATRIRNDGDVYAFNSLVTDISTELFTAWSK